MTKKTSEKIGAWLMHGEITKTTLDMLAVYLGEKYAHIEAPLQVTDFRKCMAFLVNLPFDDRTALIGKLAGRNSGWRVLSIHWIDLMKLWEIEKYSVQMPKLSKFLQDVYVKYSRS